MVAEEADSDVHIHSVAFADIDRAEVAVWASVAVGVDAYDVIDGDSLAVDAHVDEVSHPANLDTLPFRRLLVYPILLHGHGCVDAMGQ